MVETPATSSFRLRGQVSLEDETPFVGIPGDPRAMQFMGRVGAALLVTVGALGIAPPAAAGPSTPISRVDQTDILRMSGLSRLTNTGVLELGPVATLTNSREASGPELVPSELSEESRDPALPSYGDALSQLAEWLQMTDGELATLVGVSRRTVVNWRANRGGYGATTRRLFATHALVSQLTAKEGLSRSRLWLNGLAFDGTKTRLQAMASGPDGFTAVLQQAEPLIFPEVPARRVDVDELDMRDLSLDSAQSDALAAGPRDADAFQASPRRPRRP